MFAITKIIDLSEITFFKNYFRLTESVCCSLLIFLNFSTWNNFIKFTLFTRPSCLPPEVVGDGLPVHQVELRYCSARPSGGRVHRSPHHLLPHHLHDSVSCPCSPGHRPVPRVSPVTENVRNIFTWNEIFFTSTNHSVMTSFDWMRRFEIRTSKTRK